MTQPSTHSRQTLLNVGAVLLGLGLLSLFGWLVYQDATARLATTKLPPGLLDQGIFYIEGMKTLHWVLFVAGLFLLGLPLMLKRGQPTAGKGADTARRPKGPPRLGACNVLQAEKDVRQLWQFKPAGDRFALQREETKLPNEPLPANLIAKDWQTLFQPKLNVAWLPSNEVFLRALQVPRADNAAELQSMIELQLEKVSPMPVAQVVWTFEALPARSEELQTVIVLIVARSKVEEFLGKLEGQGYLADRLELPLLDQIRATETTTDGLWIYTGVGPDPWTCLAAWWYGGVLRNLTLVRLPATETRGQVLQEQLNQMAWAGEIEGWLTAPPSLHLIADEETAAAWLPLFTVEQHVEVIPPVLPAELAALTARRAATADVSVIGLLPPEFTARYRQQFIDRLWMRGLGGVVLLYIFFVIIYFGLTEWAKWRLDSVNSEIALKANSYTNALQMREQVKVLQDQLDLQYAALETYKAVADHLPDGLILDAITFRGGREVTLMGSAEGGEMSKVQEFNTALRKAAVKDQPLFANLDAANISSLQGNQVKWNFRGELRRTEASP
jgi:hypothetical protein